MTDLQNAPATTLGDVLPLGGTDWRIWSDYVVRSAGFAIQGMAPLAAPALEAADREVAAGRLSETDFAALHRDESVRCGAFLQEVCRDPAFRTAIAWQNRPFVEYLDKVANRPVEQRNAKARYRERMVARYWQRYCTKAETIGFFGPVHWSTIERGREPVTYQPGASLVDERQCALETWAVIEIGNALAARPEVRRHLPALLRADLTLRTTPEGGEIVVSGRRPERLTSAEARILALCNGTRTAGDVAAIVTDGDRQEATEQIVELFERLSRKRLLTWGANIPIFDDAEEMLDTRLLSISDPRIRAECLAVWDDIKAARDGVAAAGSDGELVEALRVLDEKFESLTGSSASHGGGRAYAGRAVCVEDTTRAGQLTLGSSAFDQIAEPLAMLAGSATWFSRRLAQEYVAAIGGLAAGAQGRHTDRPVPLARIWAESLRLFWGPGELPLHRASAALAAAWSEVLDVTDEDLQRAQLNLSVTACRERFQRVFGTDPTPGWQQGGVHSPDLQVIARDIDAFRSGDFTVVAGELHACIASLDTPAIAWPQGTTTVHSAVNESFGSGRVVPVFPLGWRRNTGRFVPAVAGAGDTLLGFSKAPVRDRDQLVAIDDLNLHRDGDDWAVVAGDGRRWGLAEFFGVPLSIVAADAFKVGLGGDHIPRVSLDKLVIFRQTWRVRSTDVGLTGRSKDEADDYRVIRRWARETGLPARVFVKAPGEDKPVYVDLTSPVYVATLAGLIRRLTDDERLTVGEMLPDVDQTWLPGAAGSDDTYVSELRVQLVHEASIAHPQRTDTNYEGMTS